jgi:hypothetical protein
MCGSEIAAQRYKEGKKRFCSYKCKSAAQIKEKSEKDIAQRRIEARMAAIIGYSLKKIGKAKDGCSWQSLVGYTRAELMGHLESQFEPGMSWDNIGVWHIDHKRPRVSFSYASVDDPQFKECWALENLQPLWAKDNLSKGSRLDWVRPVAA